MAASTPTLKLASGASMPQVGFGLWKVPADEAADTVYNVWNSLPPSLFQALPLSARMNRVFFSCPEIFLLNPV